MQLNVQMQDQMQVTYVSSAAGKGWQAGDAWGICDVDQAAHPQQTFFALCQEQAFFSFN